MTRKTLMMTAAALLATGVAHAQVPAVSGDSPAANTPPANDQSYMPAPGSSLELADVPRPEHTLINLTIYARGMDIGHVGALKTDTMGRPVRVQVVFNSGRAPVWVDANEVRYDGVKHQITTDLDAQAIGRRL
jgi:hypothetical protein